jgi:hypothetical protein
MENIYNQLPSEALADFYYHINLNIEKGILSGAMYHEIELIKQAAFKRGISLEWLASKHLLLIRGHIPKDQ